MIDITKIAPQGDKCVVEAFTRSKTTESGLEISESENDATPVMGTILRAGTLSKYAAGTNILFRRYGIDELKFSVGANEVIVFIIADDEVVAVIEK